MIVAGAWLVDSLASGLALLGAEADDVWSDEASLLPHPAAPSSTTGTSRAAATRRRDSARAAGTDPLE